MTVDPRASSPRSRPTPSRGDLIPPFEPRGRPGASLSPRNLRGGSGATLPDGPARVDFLRIAGEDEPGPPGRRIAMEPTPELVDDLYRAKVLRARAMAPEER